METALFFYAMHCNLLKENLFRSFLDSKISLFVL